MKFIRDLWPPALFAVHGVVLAHFVSFEIGSSNYYLSATSTSSAILLSSTLAICFAFIVTQNSTILALQKSGFYGTIASKLKLTILSFLTLIAIAFLGFFFKGHSLYLYTLLGWQAFSIGLFVQVIYIVIGLMLEMQRRGSLKPISKEEFEKHISDVARGIGGTENSV